jgi:PEP-CTERM motif
MIRVLSGVRISSIAVGLLLLGSATLTFADVLPVDGSWAEFGFDLAGTFAYNCPGCTPTTNPVANQSLTPPWTFSGPATLTVLDLFQIGDEFEVFDNDFFLGLTQGVANTGVDACGNDIGCALADAGPTGYSEGVFDILGAGAHSITIEVYQNALGSGGGAAVLSASAPAVPEPASVALFGTVLAGVVVALKRKLVS